MSIWFIILLIILLAGLAEGKELANARNDVFDCCPSSLNNALSAKSDIFVVRNEGLQLGKLSRSAFTTSGAIGMLDYCIYHERSNFDIFCSSQILRNFLVASYNIW